MTQPRPAPDEGNILLLTAFEVAGVGICFTDEAGAFVRVNPAFCKMLGYRADELIGQPWALIATPALAADPAAFYADMITHAARVSGEWEVRRKDGSHLSTLVSCKPIPRPGGTVLLVSTFTDIHERKGAELEIQRLNRDLEQRIAERTVELSKRLQQLEASETAMRASEEQYRLVFNNASEGIVVMQDGHIVLANPRVERLVGMDAATMTTLPFTDRIHPDDRAAVVERYRRRMQGLEVEPVYSFRVVHVDGSVLWAELAGVLVEWQGKPATLAFITDITERKQLEDNLKQALEDRETILATTVVGIAFLNPKGRLYWGNLAIGEIFGFDVAAEIGVSLEKFYPSRDAYLRVGTEVSAAVREGRAFVGELEMRRNNGELFWVQLSGKAVSQQDLSRGTVWNVIDITRRKQAEQDIRKALDQQRELNELKSRFVSMTSHEYRTPLSTILSAAELMRDYGERLSKTETAGIIESIEVAVRRMTQMLDNILLIGRADAGRVEFLPEPMAVQSFCRTVADDVIAAAAVDSGRFEFSCSLPAETALADERLLRHILSNLLTNAFKYSPAEGHVWFSVAAEDGRLRFEVRDEGIGIPEDDMPRLFETFHRAKNVGNIAGTGLGMAIVKRAVELHNGNIAVSSRVGEGSTFVVQVPWLSP